MKKFHTMTRQRFFRLSQGDKDLWTERLKHEGFALDDIVEFDHVGPLIHSVVIRQRNADGRLALHECSEPGCDFEGHAGIERRLISVNSR